MLIYIHRCLLYFYRIDKWLYLYFLGIDLKALLYIVHRDLPKVKLFNRDNLSILVLLELLIHQMMTAIHFSGTSSSNIIFTNSLLLSVTPIWCKNINIKIYLI